MFERDTAVTKSSCLHFACLLLVTLNVNATAFAQNEPTPTANASATPTTTAEPASPVAPTPPGVDYHQPTGAPRVFDHTRLGHVWFGKMTLSYSDDQTNSAGDTMKFTDVAMTAMRAGLEYQRDATSRLTLDVRQFTVDNVAWTRRLQAFATMGTILPWAKVIMPEFGLAWGRDTINWSHRDAPRAGRQWQRNFIFGGTIRWSVFDWGIHAGHYVLARYYMFDPWSAVNSGSSWEAGFGTALQWHRWRGDLIFGYTGESYTAADQNFLTATDRALVRSTQRGTTLTGVIWL